MIEKISYEKKKRLVGYVFVAPWILGAIFFFILPLVQSFIFSISEIHLDLGKITTKIIGIEMYIRAFKRDPAAMQQLGESLVDILLQTLYVAILSIFIAIILKQKFRGRLLARAIFFLPVIVTSGIVISIIRGESTSAMSLGEIRSSTMVKPFELEALMQQIGFPGAITTFLTDLIGTVINYAWLSGVQILIILAGLQTVPVHLYEAARIDGATGWEAFWFVTFPLITPILLLTTVYTIIDGLSDYSNEYQQTILVYANQYMNYSYSSTLACIYFVAVIAIVGFIFFVTRNKVFYMVD